VIRVTTSWGSGKATEGGLGFGGGAGELGLMHGDTAVMARRCAAMFQLRLAGIGRRVTAQASMEYEEDEMQERRSRAVLGYASHSELKRGSTSVMSSSGRNAFLCPTLARTRLQMGRRGRAKQGESTSMSNLKMLRWWRHYTAAMAIPVSPLRTREQARERK
jgi:hypothetical protein